MRLKIAAAMRVAVIGGLDLDALYRKFQERSDYAVATWEDRADIMLMALDRLGLEIRECDQP